MNPSSQPAAIGASCVRTEAIAEGKTRLADQWRERIAEQRRSGIRIKQFCRERGFYAWRKPRRNVPRASRFRRPPIALEIGDRRFGAASVNPFANARITVGKSSTLPSRRPSLGRRRRARTTEEAVAQNTLRAYPLRSEGRPWMPDTACSRKICSPSLERGICKCQRPMGRFVSD